MSDIRGYTIQALEALGEMAQRLGTVTGGMPGIGLTGAASALHTIARVMRDGGEDVEEILRRIKAPRDLAMPWDESASDTRPEKPGAKRGSP